MDFDGRPYNTLTLPYERVISARSLCLTGAFRGRAIERRHTNSTTTNPRCHGNKMWDKISYNSVCTIDISEMFASNRGFSGSGCRMMLIKFSKTDPGCHGNEIWDKTGYNSAHIENIAVPLPPSRGIRGWYWMMSDKFYHNEPRSHGNQNLRQNRL